MFLILSTPYTIEITLSPAINRRQLLPSSLHGIAFRISAKKFDEFNLQALTNKKLKNILKEI
jgi:hypothetical protein